MNGRSGLERFQIGFGPSDRKRAIQISRSGPNCPIQIQQPSTVDTGQPCSSYKRTPPPRSPCILAPKPSTFQINTKEPLSFQKTPLTFPSPLEFTRKPSKTCFITIIPLVLEYFLEYYLVFQFPGLSTSKGYNFLIFYPNSMILDPKFI